MRPKPSDSRVVRAEAPCSSALWAAEQFGRAQLGDARLTARLVQVGAAAAERPADSLPQASGGWAATKGAYRLIENKSVRREAIWQSVFEAAGRRCAGRAVVYDVQDTTDLVFPTAREAGAQMGYVNDLQVPALHLHSALALDEQGVALGLLHAELWARDPADYGKKEQRRVRPIEEKESAKWLRAIEGAAQALDQGAVGAGRPYCIHVLDREGDIYEVFQDILQRRDGAVIRAMQDRRVEAAEDQERLAYARVRAQKPLGERTVAVPRKGARPARKATVAVRACRVDLLAPARLKAACRRLTLWLVEALEELGWLPRP